MSRPVDAGVWQLSLRHKTCRDLRKGFRGVGTAETRLGSRGQLSENSSSRHGTPGTVPTSASLHPGHSPRALRYPHAELLRRTSITHSPYRYYHHQIITLYTTQTRPYPGHSLPCQTRAPTSHCTPIATPSTSSPPHRLSCSANCGTAAPHRPPYHPVRATCNILLCSSLPAPLSPLHAHRLLLLTGTCIDEHRRRKRRS